jgi:hypothetical protein
MLHSAHINCGSLRISVVDVQLIQRVWIKYFSLYLFLFFCLLGNFKVGSFYALSALTCWLDAMRCATEEQCIFASQFWLRVWSSEFYESFVWLTGAVLGICGVLKLKFVVLDEKEWVDGRFQCRRSIRSCCSFVGNPLWLQFELIERYEQPGGLRIEDWELLDYLWWSDGIVPLNPLKWVICWVLWIWEGMSRSNNGSVINKSMGNLVDQSAHL